MVQSRVCAISGFSFGRQTRVVVLSSRKTMSEFKRTHEEAGITDFRRMLTEDQWETLQGISNTASYFA